MKPAVFLLLVSFFTQGVNAEVVANREERQGQRIENGIKNGSLTGIEAKKLNHQQKRIQKMEDRAQADGSISKKERKHLQRAQNNASRDIKRKKHNQR